MTTEVYPIEHYNYDELEKTCLCALCAGVRELNILTEPTGLSVDSVARHTAMSKYTVYCEMSFFIMNKLWKKEMLGWLGEKMQDPNYMTEKEWYIGAYYKRMEWWIQEWIRDTANPKTTRVFLLCYVDEEGRPFNHNKIVVTIAFHEETKTYVISEDMFSTTLFRESTHGWSKLIMRKIDTKMRNKKLYVSNVREVNVLD